MDQAFHVSWERNGSVKHFCTRPIYAEIECNSTTSSGLNMGSRYIFTISGMIEEMSNLNANVSSNKAGGPTSSLIDFGIFVLVFGNFVLILERRIQLTTFQLGTFQLHQLVLFPFL